MKPVMVWRKRSGIERAAICGVSFGGLIAVRFAAEHPARCSALVLASTPQPALRLRRRHQQIVVAPEIAREDQRLFLVRQRDRTGAEQVADRQEHEVDLADG